jgi:hypothetical protein
MCVPERRLTAAAGIAMLLCFGVFLGAAAEAATRPGLITQTSIAGATLGGTTRDYSRVLGAPDFRTPLAGGLVRLTFMGGDLQVFLSRGRGVAVLTSSNRLHTADGIGPCADVSQLRRVYGRRLVAHKTAQHPTAVAFSSGHLSFATPSRTVAAVLLARAPERYFALLLNSSSCGGGREG